MSLEINEQTAKQIAEINLVANTPGYLFKRLRHHSYIQELAREHSLGIFHDSIKVFQDKAKLSDIDQLLVYIVIAALSLKSERDVVTILREAKKLPVRWAAPMVDLAETLVQLDTFKRIDLRNKMPLAKHSFIKSNASADEIFFALKPTI